MHVGGCLAYKSVGKSCLLEATFSPSPPPNLISVQLTLEINQAFFKVWKKQCFM